MFHVDTFILKQKNRFGFTRCLGKPPATRKDHNFEANFLYQIGRKKLFWLVQESQVSKADTSEIVLVVSVSFYVCKNTGCFG